MAPSTVYALKLSQIVNQTNPLNANDLPKYSATWFVTFDVRTDELFVAETRYSFFQRYQTNLSITLESSIYYVKNLQQPIVRQTEVIFHNLLFTIVVLELFGLSFLICKLLLAPLIRLTLERIRRFRSKSQVDTAPNDNTISRAIATELQ